MASIVRLSSQLTASLREVVDSAPLTGLGPIELARKLGLDKSFASRLMSALRADDPLVALSQLPGVVPLRQFLAAAGEHRVATRIVRKAEASLRTFDHELERSFETRTRLDALIADELPQMRRRHDDTARQAVYRGMALVKGVSVDLESFTWVVHPSRTDGKRVDILFLAAMAGVHRLRPTARFRVGASHSRGRPKFGAKLLRKFCEPAELSIEVSKEKDYVFYEISTGSVRRDAAANFFLTEFYRNAALRSDPAGEKGIWSVGDVVAYPVKRLELILLVHREVWRGCAFTVRSYDTAGRGLVRLPDPERDVDLLSLDAHVVTTPATSEVLRTSSVPNYREILRHLMKPLGWKMEGSAEAPPFRKISCEITYPLYGAQAILVRETT